MSKKNICFVANYEKTMLFDKMAQKIPAEIDGAKVFWITVNKFLYETLLENYPKETILLIDKDAVLNYQQKNSSKIDYKLNELWFGDRVLKHEKWGKKYLSNLAFIYKDFISENNISAVFGEQTWAHELLLHRVCSTNTELNSKYFYPTSIRMPSGKYAFFNDEFGCDIISFKTDSECEEMPLLQAKKPDYLALNNKVLSAKSKPSYFIKKFKYFFTERLKEAHDPTKPDDLKRAFKGFFSYYLNKKLYAWFVKEIKKEALVGKDFVVFTLHKQPEASVDNTGRYYEDQLVVIKNIWRILPEDTMLIVKEHSNAIGDRPLSFYKTISKMDNVAFVEYQEDSYSLIEMSKAVFTISGTIAYEAALMGKHSFTFAPLFFNKLSLCNHITLEDLRDPKKTLDNLIASYSYDKQTDQNYTNWIYANSFEGIMSDYNSNPACMEEDNVDKLVKAIKVIVNI